MDGPNFYFSESGFLLFYFFIRRLCLSPSLSFFYTSRPLPRLCTVFVFHPENPVTPSFLFVRLDGERDIGNNIKASNKARDERNSEEFTANSGVGVSR